MSYTVIISHGGIEDSRIDVDTLEKVRELAQQIVQDRMDAFGEDREALRQYGFIDAENKALDMTDWGGKIVLQDGWVIEVVNNDVNKEA